jgi:hypothetical protein
LILGVWCLDKGLDCQFCTDQLKAVRGHDGFEPRIVANVEVDRCPALYVSEAENLLIEAYAQYKNGFLPNAGGWLDQPMRFIQAMGIISEAVAQVTKKDDHG